MKKILISDNYFIEDEKFEPKNNIESTLYIKNNDLIKRLKKEYLNREITINNLEILKDDRLVTPKYTLYDINGFVGYGMNFYEDYYILRKMLTDENISFEKRKKIALSLCSLFEYLEAYNFGYWDLHTQNILCKDTDIKLVDMDSGIFNDDENINFDSYIKYEQKSLSKIILGLLYKQKIAQTLVNFRNNKNKVLRNIPNNVKPFYKYTISEKSNFFHCGEYIENLNEETIEKTKELIRY